MRHLIFAITLAAAGMLAGCAGFGVHRIDIQQGNLVTQEQLAKVKPGMSRNDVRNALGTPLLSRGSCLLALAPLAFFPDTVTSPLTGVECETACRPHYR